MDEPRMYIAAKFYLEQCGFLIAPLQERSKMRLLKGTYFDQHHPEDRHLRSWFVTSTKAYNLAIVPGEPSGNLVILDFDEPGSFDAWHAATRIETPRVLSRRGVHVYVRLSQMVNNGCGYFNGKQFGDVIAHGNITAPPSIHPSGHEYRWHGNPRAVPLFRCLSALQIERRSPGGATASFPRPTPAPSVFHDEVFGVDRSKIKNMTAYVQAAIRGECRKVMSAPKGTRNHALFRAALNVAKFSHIVPEQTIFEELAQAAALSGMKEQEDSITPTIRSGLAKGMNKGVIRA